MPRKISKLLQLLTVAISLLWGNAVLAAAFYLSEFGTPSSVGTAGVGSTVNTSGADAAWTNPAGMTGQSEDSMLAGLMVISPELKFDSSVATAGGGDGGNAGDTAAVPSFFYTRVLSDESRFGFSFVSDILRQPVSFFYFGGKRAYLYVEISLPFRHEFLFEELRVGTQKISRSFENLPCTPSVLVQDNRARYFKVLLEM